MYAQIAYNPCYVRIGSRNESGVFAQIYYYPDGVGWSWTWGRSDSEHQLHGGVSAVGSDLTAEIKSTRGQGFVSVFIYICGRQLFSLREVTSIVRGFVWQQPHVVQLAPLEYYISTRCHSLCLLCL